jgi:hypothetical protein
MLDLKVIVGHLVHDHILVKSSANMKPFHAIPFHAALQPFSFQFSKSQLLQHVPQVVP